MEVEQDPEVINVAGENTAGAEEQKDADAAASEGATAGAEEQKDADAAASEGATAGVDDAGVETGDVNAGLSMDVDDGVPSDLSSTDHINRINNELANTSKRESRANILMNQPIMDIPEDDLQKVTQSICTGPPEVNPWHQVAPPPLASLRPPLMFQQPPLMFQPSPLMFQPPPLMYQSSPQVTQPPPHAPTDFSVRSESSWEGPYDLDFLRAHRSLPSPGRDSHGDLATMHGRTWFRDNNRSTMSPGRDSHGDLATMHGRTWFRDNNRSTTSPGRDSHGDLATMHGRTWFRDNNRSTRHERLHPARFAPYDRANRDNSGSTALHMSRFVQGGPRGHESDSQPPPLVYPDFYPIQKHATREPEPYQSIRQLLNPSLSIVNPSQTATPRFTSQYSPQSLSMVFKQASSPTSLITSSTTISMPSSPPSLVSMSAPRSSPITRSQSPSWMSTKLFDLPYVSDEPQQPLDFSLLPRQLPTVIPISQAQIRRFSETSTVAQPRLTPRTHTVTSTDNTVSSTNNTIIYCTHDLITRTEEHNQTTDRIEMYKSCSEHLLNQLPTHHRARTPPDILPEHLQYKSWPVDNLTLTDHIEELDTIEVDSWLDSIESELQSIQPTPITCPPPMIIIEPPLSPDTTRPTSPGSTTSS